MMTKDPVCLVGVSGVHPNSRTFHQCSLDDQIKAYDSGSRMCSKIVARLPIWRLMYGVVTEILSGQLRPAEASSFMNLGMDIIWNAFSETDNRLARKVRTN